MNIRNIVWKDIFKPRWAVVFKVGSHPNIEQDAGGFRVFGRLYFADVFDRPHKRPLDMSFNEFYGRLSEQGNVVAGYYLALRSLIGIGSTNKTNMSNPILMKKEKPRMDSNSMGGPLPSGKLNAH